jgi:hypothetical protein
MLLASLISPEAALREEPSWDLETQRKETKKQKKDCSQTETKTKANRSDVWLPIRNRADRGIQWLSKMSPFKSPFSKKLL